MGLIRSRHFVSKGAPTKSGLTFRARKILYAAITEYIASGEPVGSRRLARRYGLNLSPATVRNVLADLEDGGYLTQPHTSAGRVPTDRGFRVFVDALVQMREVSSDNRNAIVARMRELKGRTDDLMRESGKLLSSLTGAASVIVSPRPQDEQLAQLRFLPPSAPKELLAVLVTTSGAIQNRVVKLDQDVGPEDLARFHNYLGSLGGEPKSGADPRRAGSPAQGRAWSVRVPQPGSRRPRGSDARPGSMGTASGDRGPRAPCSTDRSFPMPKRSGLFCAPWKTRRSS